MARQGNLEDAGVREPFAQGELAMNPAVMRSRVLTRHSQLRNGRLSEPDSCGMIRVVAAAAIFRWSSIPSTSATCDRGNKGYPT